MKIIGYSLSDSDLVRILRHLSINQVLRRVASNVFALIDLPKSVLEDPGVGCRKRGLYRWPNH